MIFELSGNFCDTMCADFVAELDIFVVKRYGKQNFAGRALLSAPEKKVQYWRACAQEQMNRHSSPFLHGRIE